MRTIAAQRARERSSDAVSGMLEAAKARLILSAIHGRGPNKNSREKVTTGRFPKLGEISKGPPFGSFSENVRQGAYRLHFELHEVDYTNIVSLYPRMLIIKSM